MKHACLRGCLANVGTVARDGRREKVQRVGDVIVASAYDGVFALTARDCSDCTQPAYCIGNGTWALNII